MSENNVNTLQAKWRGKEIPYKYVHDQLVMHKCQKSGKLKVTQSNRQSEDTKLTCLQTVLFDFAVTSTMCNFLSRHDVYSQQIIQQSALLFVCSLEP